MRARRITGQSAASSPWRGAFQVLGLTMLCHGCEKEDDPKVANARLESKSLRTENWTLAQLKERIGSYSDPLKRLMQDTLLLHDFVYDRITISNDDVVEVHGCLHVPLQSAEGVDSKDAVRIPDQFDHLNDYHYLFKQFYSGVHSDTDRRSEPKPKSRWGAQTLWWEEHLPFAIVYSECDNLEVFVHTYTVIEDDWHRSACHEQLVIKRAPPQRETR